MPGRTPKNMHKMQPGCSKKPTVRVEWAEQRSGRKWRETECQGCGIRVRQVLTSPMVWRPWYQLVPHPTKVDS